MFDQHEVKRAAAERVLEQMPAGVSIVDVSSGRIIFVNRAAQEMWE